MKRIPLIKTVMTAFPYAVEVDAPLVEAQDRLTEHGIHHLPVVKDQELVGVISSRDVSLASATATGDLKVADVYVAEPYIVELDERLDHVLSTMAERHIGSTLVTRQGKLAGIFTMTDACRQFSEYLRAQFRPQGGDDAA